MNFIATAFYVEISRQQMDELRRGWDGPTAQAYHHAKYGPYDEEALRLFKPAARVSCDSKDAELVWATLQNIHASWTERNGIKTLTSFPRSMDVGDVVMWDDDEDIGHRVDTVGFQTIKLPVYFKKMRNAMKLVLEYYVAADDTILNWSLIADRMQDDGRVDEAALIHANYSTIMTPPRNFFSCLL